MCDNCLWQFFTKRPARFAASLNSVLRGGFIKSSKSLNDLFPGIQKTEIPLIRGPYGLSIIFKFSKFAGKPDFLCWSIFSFS